MDPPTPAPGADPGLAGADAQLARAAVLAAAERGWLRHDQVWELCERAVAGHARSLQELFGDALTLEQIDEIVAATPLPSGGGAAKSKENVTLPGPRPIVAQAPLAFCPPGEGRYEILEDLGTGGLGKVVRATDRVVGREVALKTLRDGMGMPRDAVDRFTAEGRVTALLEHPNIVPVYEIGAFPNGQPYYTMRIVKQRSLQDVLASAELRAEWPLIRLVAAFVQISRALAYAHQRGVLHRDIKPENILLGDFGEVYLADWGNAKALPLGPDGRPASSPPGAPIDVPETVGYRHRHELTGPSGTPGYMAPEQFRRDKSKIDQRADIFALGVVLYEILTGQHPFDASTVLGVILATQTREPRSPRSLSASCPLILEDLCMAMLAKIPADRPESAERVAAEVEAFLEGARERARRHEEAHRLCELAQLPVERYHACGEERERLLIEARRALQGVKGYEPVERKRPAWELEDRAANMEREQAVSMAEAIDLFTKALAYDALSVEARASLSDLYWSRAVDAEAQRQTALRIYYEALVLEFDVGRYTALLRSDAMVSIASDPNGAVVTAYLYQQRDRVLVPVEQRILGRTPVVEAHLPAGSYLFVLRRAGYRDVKYPALLKRGEHHVAAVNLYTDAEIGEGFVHIPGGPFVCGGDAAAVASLDRSEPDLPDFAIARFPVTLRAYCAFLDALDRIDPALADRRAPHDVRGSEGYAVARGPSGWSPRDMIIEGEARKLFPPEEGHLWNVPVVLVDWFDAAAYCRWRSQEDGTTVRLPTELEWEKAARGVDGRVHPWGDHFDPTFCLMQASRPYLPQVEPIGTFPTDCSPYDVRDMAGGIREWMGDIQGERTAAELGAEPEPDALTERGASPERIIRSGAWVAMSEYSRSASRSRFFALTRGTGLGFRVVKGLTRARGRE
jgi:serine/threonine-protein kinase